MKKPDRITAVFGAVLLAAVAAVGAVSAFAAGGTQDDPLVTLSYLTKVTTPALMEKVDEQVAANEQALTGRIDAAIDAYSQQVEQALAQGGGESYVPISLSAGQIVTLEAGCELLLRSGSAQVTTGGVPALLDATDGGGLESGGALRANHLYVSPLSGTVITVSSGCVLLVRGGYTIL